MTKYSTEFKMKVIKEYVMLAKKHNNPNEFVVSKW